MVALNLMNENRKNIMVRSRDIENMLNINEDIEVCQDMSDNINEKDILVFDCQLAKRLFDLEEEREELIEIFGEDIIGESIDVYYEDVYSYIKETTDEIEEEIQEKYIYDNVRCHYEIYNINQEFDDFKFVLIVAFKDVEIKKLQSLAGIIANRQLEGKSKFYS